MTHSKNKLPKINQFPQKEIEEQECRLRIFLEIVSEADLLLLKKLMQHKENNGLKRAA